MRRLTPWGDFATREYSLAQKTLARQIFGIPSEYEIQLSESKLFFIFSSDRLLDVWVEPPEDAG
jgi:hypothetical protein